MLVSYHETAELGGRRRTWEQRDLREPDDVHLLKHLLDILREGAVDLHGVGAHDEVVNAEPSRDPGATRAENRHCALERARGARIDGLGGTLQVEEGAVGATDGIESLFNPHC